MWIRMNEDTGFQFTDDAVPRAYEEVLVTRLFEPGALLLLLMSAISVQTRPFSMWRPAPELWHG